MPDDIFGVAFEQPKPERAPTLAQYLKTLPKKTKELDQDFLVRVVWLPGKFDNVTLQTHKFRIIFGPTHALYKYFTGGEYVGSVFKDCGAIGVKITNQQSGEFQLNQRDRTPGYWTGAGSSGYRFVSS